MRTSPTRSPVPRGPKELDECSQHTFNLVSLILKKPAHMAVITAGSRTSGSCCDVSMTSGCLFGGGGGDRITAPTGSVLADRYSTAGRRGVAELLIRMRGQFADGWLVDCFLVG
jgi:hypothetical protein